MPPLVVFGIGALTTSFVKGWREVSVLLSYVTRHSQDGARARNVTWPAEKREDWLGYLLHASFVPGAAAGGAISMVVTGPQMLAGRGGSVRCDNWPYLPAR